MQVVDTGRVRSAINVTPLVDVVLVLLVIFMLIAPQLESGPALKLPETDRPPERQDGGQQVRLTLERDGALWIDGRRVTAEELPDRIREAAARLSDAQVVLEGDARSSFGEVQRVMLVVEAAGFEGVALIAKRREGEE